MNIDFSKAVIISEEGTQGIVGVVPNKKDGITYIYKLSYRIDYAIEHECLMAKFLNKIRLCCPHFLQYIESKNVPVDPLYMNQEEPFQLYEKHPIKIQTIFLKYLKNGLEFYDVMAQPDFPLFCVVKQVIAAITMAQLLEKFCHYDLHSCNIMIKKCKSNRVFLYKINDNTNYLIPTNGYYPVIIDYGYSYCKRLNGKPLYSSLLFENLGFTPFKFNKTVDMRVFLISLNNDLTSNGNKNSTLNNIVKNLFGKHNKQIDWERGWYKYKNKSVIDKLCHTLKKIKYNSCILNSENYYGMELFQGIITLPIRKRKIKDYVYITTTLDSELCKLNNIFSDDEDTDCNYNLYILKTMVTKAREIRSMYKKVKTRADSIIEFKACIVKEYLSLTDKPTPDLNYDVILCSLYLLANCIEGLLYNQIYTSREPNWKVDDIKDIFKIIDTNFPTKVVFSKDTKLRVWDGVNLTNKDIELSFKDVYNLNKLNTQSKIEYINNCL